MKNLCFFLVSCLLITSCAAPTTYHLMPVPVMFADSSVDPFSHLPEELKKQRFSVYYATNRQPASRQSTEPYSNAQDSTLHFGRAIVRMGDPDTSWQSLQYESLSTDRNAPVSISLESIEEIASLPESYNESSDDLPDHLGVFFKQINRELSLVDDKEIMVYVHGTKVDFRNAAILASEVEHFGGRDFVSLAYAWPSHQNILSYVVGIDLQRARDSSGVLADTLSLLSRHTIAEKINILSYSAGCRVASKALAELRDRFPYYNQNNLRQKFRIGSVIFAAADVEIDLFLERLSAAGELADQVVITVSDKDNALQAAKKYMGGPLRAGTEEAVNEEVSYLLNHSLENVSIIDVSLGQEIRGFDIVGHHYWYRHPWMSSDIIFVMRTDLPPSRRGLQTTEPRGLWYLPVEYPARVKKAVQTELGTKW